ncbi:MAG: hypothetical protein RI907_3510 [Pseudomonadota bacterium]|jgi:hypothetical protein
MADAAKLHLPDVTLCCVDTRSLPQATQALRRCLDQATFGRAVFLSGTPTAALQAQVPEVDWQVIPPLRGITDYNRVVLQELLPHVHTSHVLIVQWDGFITHPQLWQDDFLSVDYIGPPWYHGGHPGLVGNGGFSLRSRRLLQACSHMSFDMQAPEDETLCVHRRSELEQAHGIRYAPLAMAQAFGCEYGQYRPTFGFHGMHNFAHVLSPQALASWLDTAPADLLKHQHSRKLIKELMRHGRAKEARLWLRRRAALMGWTGDQINLYVRSCLHGLT